MVERSDAGNSVATNANFGYVGFDLRETRLVRSVEEGDPLTMSDVHGFIGIGHSDSHGNYDTAFIRAAQEELDLNFATVEVVFFEKSRQG